MAEKESYYWVSFTYEITSKSDPEKRLVTAMGIPIKTDAPEFLIGATRVAITKFVIGKFADRPVTICVTIQSWITISKTQYDEYKSVIGVAL